MPTQIELINGIEKTLACHVVSPYIMSVLLKPEKVINNTSAGAYSQKLNNKILKENFKSLEDKKTKKIDGALLYA